MTNSNARKNLLKNNPTDAKVINHYLASIEDEFEDDTLEDIFGNDFEALNNDFDKWREFLAI